MESEIERFTQLCCERHVIGFATGILQDVERVIGIVVGQLMTHVSMSEVDGRCAVPIDVGIRNNDGVEVFIDNAFKREIDVPRQFAGSSC